MQNDNELIIKSIIRLSMIPIIKKKTGVVCLFCFLIGLLFTTGAGEYWLKMFDSFAGTIGLVVVALLEMIAVIYVYGHEKYVNFMRNRENCFTIFIYELMPNKICLSHFAYTQVYRRHLSNDWNPARIVLATNMALYRSDYHGSNSWFLCRFDDHEKSNVWSMECRACTYLCDTCLLTPTNKFYL